MADKQVFSARVSMARRGVTTALFLLALTGPVLAADDDDTSNSWSEKMTDSVKNTFGGAAKRLGLDKPPPPPPSEAPSGCPTVALLPGTEAQRVMTAGTTGNEGLRYQYSLMTVGRECSVSGSGATIKVGADGRVLLGPAGTAGRFDVPIRVAIFSEVQQKVVQSRLFRVPVSIPAGEAAANFNFVSDGMTVAMLRGHGNDYSIKVGIDAGKGEGGTAPATKKHRHRKGTPEATANASQ